MAYLTSVTPRRNTVHARNSPDLLGSVYVLWMVSARFIYRTEPQHMDLNSQSELVPLQCRCLNMSQASTLCRVGRPVVTFMPQFNE